MANMNEAYDLELFSPREPQLVPLPGDKKAAREKKRRSRAQQVMNTVVYLGIALAVVFVVGYLITCNVRLTEMNQTLGKLQTELNIQHSERVRLEAELSAKTSAEQLDTYARENGMLPAESGQICYIHTENDDLVTVPADGGNVFERVWRAICDFLT